MLLILCKYHFIKHIHGYLKFYFLNIRHSTPLTANIVLSYLYTNLEENILYKNVLGFTYILHKNITIICQIRYMTLYITFSKFCKLILQTTFF